MYMKLLIATLITILSVAVLKYLLDLLGLNRRANRTAQRMIKPRVAARLAVIFLRRVLRIFQLALAGFLEELNVLVRQPPFYSCHS